MACSSPLLAVYKGLREDGKKKVQILTHVDDAGSIEDYRKKYEHFGHELMLLPCGSCPSCLMKRRKEWAVRCEMEAREYKDNCFVTLTYDDEHLPDKLVKKDFQRFIKSLRNEGFTIRYFGCGEYGSKTGRPHYHVILFGFIPSDLKPFIKSDKGIWQFKSELLTKLWNKGLVTVAEFSPEYAAYTAGYVEKKLGNKDCFTLMSTRPGIGRKYIEANLGKVYTYDNLVINYGSHQLGVPRYFDKVAESKARPLPRSFKNPG